MGREISARWVQYMINVWDAHAAELSASGHDPSNMVPVLRGGGFGGGP